MCGLRLKDPFLRFVKHGSRTGLTFSAGRTNTAQILQGLICRRQARPHWLLQTCLEKNYECAFGGMKCTMNPIQIHAVPKRGLGVFYWQIDQQIVRRDWQTSKLKQKKSSQGLQSVHGQKAS